MCLCCMVNRHTNYIFMWWYFGIVTHVLIWTVIRRCIYSLFYDYCNELKSIWTCVQTKCIISSPNKGWQRKIRFKIKTNLASHGSTVCAEVLSLCSLSMRFLEVVMCHPNTCQSKWILLPTNFIIDKGRNILNFPCQRNWKRVFWTLGRDPDLTWCFKVCDVDA